MQFRQKWTKNVSSCEAFLPESKKALILVAT